MKKTLLTLSALLFFAIFSPLLAQRTITGIITDEKNEPLIGASVIISGTVNGAITDIEGKYSITVPRGNDFLQFSFTGYQTKEIELSVSNVLDVSLIPGVLLTETVVTALGITKDEKALGYGSTRVDGSAIVRSGETNFIQALAAKSSGVQVTSSSGTPGASSKIQLRGPTTFTGENQPLIIIDNVPFDNQVNTLVAGDFPFNQNLSGVNESNRALDLNPDDIESVTVLKGTSAASLYGTRAASGVILITTKKGKRGLNVSYGASYEINQVNKLPELQSTYGQGFLGGLFNASNTAVVAEGKTPAEIDADPNLSADFYFPSLVNSWGKTIPTGSEKDNLNAFFQKGNILNNSLSLSGGNEFATYRFSFSNAAQKGIIPNTEFKRNTFRLQGSTGTDRFRMSASASYAVTNDQKAQNGSNLAGVMLALTRMPADFDFRGGSAANGYENLDGSQHTYFPFYDNPLWSAYRNTNTSDNNRFTGSVEINFKPVKDLNLIYRISSDAYTDARRQIFDIGSNGAADGTGELQESTNRHAELNSDLLAQYTKNFDELSLTATLGTQLNHREDKLNFARGRGFSLPNFYNMSNTSNFYSSNRTNIRRLAGVFATVDFAYKNTYYVTLAGRNDWASTFGANNKNGFFYPNASVGVVFTELIKTIPALSYGKIRTSFAQSGREPQVYTSRTYYQQPLISDGYTNGLTFPYLGQNGFGLSNVLGNPNLKPEYNTSYEAGLDLKLFKNRISLSATYYYALATNLLLNRPLAPASGSRAVVDNVGEMENKGIELEADFTIVQMKDFSWTLGGNWAQNKNKVLQTAPGVNELSIEDGFADIGSYAIVGQPFGSFYGTQWERNRDGEILIDDNKTVDGQPNGGYGLPYIAAKNGYLGSPYPKWTAAIRSALSFKGVTISGLLDIREGSQIWGGTLGRLYRLGRMAETANRSQTYIIEGRKSTIDAGVNNIPIDAYTYFNSYLGDGGAAQENKIFDGSWVRLREVTLTYDVPSGKFLKGASIYVTGKNLWLKTPYIGVDPETSLTGSGSNIGGYDYFNMPNTKGVVAGFKTNF